MISVLRFQAASETKKKKVSIGIPWDRCCEATALGKAEPDEAFVELLRKGWHLHQLCKEVKIIIPCTNNDKLFLLIPNNQTIKKHKYLVEKEYDQKLIKICIRIAAQRIPQFSVIKKGD